MPNLKAATRVTDLLGNPDDWDDELSALTREYIEDRIKDGVRQGALEAGLPPDIAVVNPQVLEWADRYSVRLAKRINETTYTRIADSLNRMLTLYDSGSVRDAIDAGLTMPEFKQVVLDVLGDETNEFRARLTAITEFARAEQSGRLDQLKASGAVTKRWVANPDCCEFCDAMDGTEVDIDANFLDLGDSVEIDGETGPAKLNVDYEACDVAVLHPACRCGFEVTWESASE